MFARVSLNVSVNPDSTDSFINFNAPEYAQTLFCQIWMQQKHNGDESNDEASLEIGTMLPSKQIYSHPNCEHNDRQYNWQKC